MLIKGIYMQLLANVTNFCKVQIQILAEIQSMRLNFRYISLILYIPNPRRPSRLFTHFFFLNAHLNCESEEHEETGLPHNASQHLKHIVKTEIRCLTLFNINTHCPHALYLLSPKGPQSVKGVDLWGQEVKRNLIIILNVSR